TISTPTNYSPSLHDALPIFKAAGEIKTKPTQHSVKELRSLGIQPDAIVLRSEMEIDEETKAKISLFSDVDTEAVKKMLDADTLRSEEHTSELQSRFDLVCRL